LIGGKFAGKKTVAQSLAEEFGLTVFNMDDVVREALNYVQPEKKEEVIDPKAKAKGKPAQEAAPVELF
jgi:dephospho-CoA kinase